MSAIQYLGHVVEMLSCEEIGRGRFVHHLRLNLFFR